MREEFKQYRQMRKEMQLLQEDLERMETLTDTVRGSSAEWPYTEHTMRVQGRHAEAEEKVRQKVRQLAGRCRRVEQAIEKAPNSGIRNILTLRYLRGMKWQQVADALGEDSEGSVQKKADRFFAEMENVSVLSEMSDMSENGML